MARIVLIFATIGGLVVVSAQIPTPAFEVASVRLNVGTDRQFRMSWSNGSFVAANIPLRMLIAQAYGITSQPQMRFTVVGGPEELLEERYDIQARIPANTPEGGHLLMLRSLLAERFHLRVRYESRLTPVYALTLAREDRRLGPELRASTIDCNGERDRLLQRAEQLTAETSPRDAKGRPVCWETSQSGPPGTRTLIAVGPLSNLVRSVQGFVERPIADATGLSGTFEWHLVFASDLQPDRELPSLFTAFEEQLGLKLQPQAAPFEVLVIDSVERPTPD